jgi:hypothetical protein
LLLDTGTADATWLRVAYAVAETQEAMRALPIPPGLADRLALGR